MQLEVCREWSDLDGLMKRFKVARCVVNAMPEIHMARQFAARHAGRVYVCYFGEEMKGGANWNHADRRVDINRTEALDASRAAVRERLVSLPRRDPMVELFAKNMTGDAKRLDENVETGAKKYRYIKTAENHFSFAFTFAWMAAHHITGALAWMHQRQAERAAAEAKRP